MGENHGGNVYRFGRESGRPLAQIIDFSASINPLGPPAGVKRALVDACANLCHYPDPQAEELTRLLAQRWGIDSDQITCGNGSTELIYLLTRILGPEEVLVAAPTFLEYERAARIYFKQARRPGNIRRLYLGADDAFNLDPDQFIAAMSALGAGRRRLAFLCNPNNPTGALMSRAAVTKIAAAARESGCFLVVDEAFMDFVPESQSVIAEVAQNPQLIVLRSLTKFYAIPGLRLGFGVFPLLLNRRVQAWQEPWTVNMPAQLAAAAALTDDNYCRETLNVICRGREMLAAGFARLGITFFPAAANYFLIRHPRAREILAALKEGGILVRDCANFAGLDESYLRVAVRGEEDNRKLLAKMEEICRG